ncbi:MFS transporter [Rhodococcus sp. ARC_M6]|uniref:MFS transporter n=1 Tax=Rhodococcus sp. ARC_M6 TaxID=2928852 RepID=UPI001FB3AD6D|nr:MFS transporter [Rhodococcus sp. ARC_M6]MCJ0905699.1 MFS transporter [Rhodococcus sp. ARC_M6]
MKPSSGIDRPPAIGMHTRRRWGVLAICCTSLFVVGLDTTIVNVALPTIGESFHVGIAGLEWVVNAYTLVLASLLISSGTLADRFGRRRVFQLGLVVFGVASIACALAPSVGVLIAARIAQGVGGSMLSPVALAIVVNVMTDPKERAKAIGVWAAVFGLSMAIGPIIGGVLIESFGWRSVFWVNVPVIVIVLMLTAVFVPESRAPQPRKLDLPGQLLLVAVVGGAVGLLIEGPRIGWTSPSAVTGYSAVALALASFVAVESRKTEPLVDLALFRHRPFSAAVLGAVVVFVALNATLLLGTLYLQQARGMTPAAAGVMILPMAVAATVCAPLSGILVGRFGPRLPLLIAGSFTALGGLCLVSLDNNTGLSTVLVAYLFLGIGFGFSNAPITNTAVNGLPKSQAGLAGGITSSARQFGAALGVALAGGFVANTVESDVAQASHAGWMLVVGCGLVVLVIAGASAHSAVVHPVRVIPTNPPAG